MNINYNTDGTLPPDAFRITGGETVTIASADGAGALYGKLALEEKIKLGADAKTLDITSVPAAKNRILNHWDNMDGTVERGYAGGSLFFKNGDFAWDPKRIEEYAKMLAAVGINGISINNVNLRDDSRRLITEERLPQLAELAAAFRPYHVRLIIAVDFAAPKTVGGLPTADSFDDGVIAWWRETAARVYAHIPDLMGFLVKADSEFQAGPAALGRTQADGANVLAAALAPHGGTVFWRCFVYDCLQDWRDTKTDRPKAAYEHFFPLDGAFAENVVLQIKIGPVDFQVNEPVSPLLGALTKTRRAIEFQVTQEYTGQQIDLYAHAVPWTRALKTLVRPGQTLAQTRADTVVGVSNVGNDANWTGNPLALANLYTFGKLAWDPTLGAEEILRDWATLTFGNDAAVTGTITEMLLQSHDVFAKYTAPLGIGWMVQPGHHYGVNVDGYEYMKWGTYHRAAHDALGVDRTSRGTNLTAQYPPEIAAVYENTDTCPQDLLLFFHRLPYSFRLKNGATLIQHIYDTHFEGVEDVRRFIATWETLEPRLQPQLFAVVAERFGRQLENAVEWRDQINTYFHRLTGIPDEKGRKIYD
ncbi:MAG: alpha-glucuronidase [Oscillospiraceae bacterium]|jgi:alpha-glucuronidase|nr:alpha-glucuronidase [Oscillospiraceae bacterium]